MAIKVVDASAVAAVLFKEPDSILILPQLAGATLWAPTLFGFEIANICVSKQRREPSKRDALKQAFYTLRTFQVHEQSVDIAQCLELAEQTGLTVYDASYLWLARDLAAPLVTLDRKLAAAH